MINFNKPSALYWSDKLKLEYIQRQIIIHSILYYELNESVISDKEFDEMSKQYVEMSKQLTKHDLQKTQYYYCMYNFDGSTGFYLFDKLSKYDKKYLMKIACIVLKLYKKG